MASEGIADTLSVELQLLLANARDSWKSFRKEVESDPINASVALQGGKGEGRTFGGGTAVLGPENYRKPEPAKPMAGLGTLLDQSLITRGSIGGSGFGPGVRPLPTASVNTVYGQVSPGVVLSPAEAAQIGQPLRTTTSRSAVAHTDREYGQYRVRAVRSGIMDPMSRGDYDREGGFQTAMAEIDYWNEQRARNRSDSAMQRQALKSQPFYGPGFNPDGTRGRRPGQAVPAVTPVDASPSSASSLLMGLTLARAATAVGGSILFAAQMADRYGSQAISQGEGFRYDSTLANAEAAYSEARGTSLGGRIGGWLVNFFAPGTANDFNTPSEAYDALIRARAQSDEAGNLRGNRARDLATANMPLRGISRSLADNNAAYTSAEAEINSEIRSRGNAGAGDLYQKIESLRRERDANNNSALADFRESMNRSEDSIQVLRSTVELKGYAASQAELSASQMGEQREFDRSSSLLSPADRARGQRLINDRYALSNEALRYGAEQSARVEVGLATARVAGADLRMSGQPLDAQLGLINASTAARLMPANLDPSDPFYRERRDAIIAEGKSQSREAAFGFGFARTQTQIGLAGESTSLDRLLARDVVGSQAQGIAASGSQRIRDLAMNGMGPEAEIARANSIKQLDVLSQDYRFAFRAEAIDAQNILINNQRDSQDPMMVLGQIEDAKTTIGQTSSNPADIQKEAFEAAMKSAMPDIIKQAVDAVLAK